MKASGMDVDSISLGEIPGPEKTLQHGHRKKQALHVGLLGMDQDETGNQYCCSFPFDKAIDPFGDVILAYEMNGQPIPRPHGFPVRAIIPGKYRFSHTLCLSNYKFRFSRTLCLSNSFLLF